MSRTMYIDLNEEDAKDIYEIILKMEGKVIDCKKQEKYELIAIAEEIEEYDIVITNCIIKYQPAINGLFLNSAIFWVETEDEEDERVFSALRRRIRKICVPTNNRQIIGRGMYQDWLNQKYNFWTMFRFKSFSIEKKLLKPLFEKLLTKNVIIKNDIVSLENADEIDYFAEDFILYREGANINQCVIHKTKIRYMYGSECIFCTYNYRNKTYELYLDIRVCADDDTTEVEKLYYDIQNEYETLLLK